MNGHDEAGRELAEAKANWDNEPSAKEAWALMIYVCDGCQHKERIWNARPHVTPFGGVPCPECSATMTHDFFGSDVTLPDHRPQKGDLIFVDLPPEIALIYAHRVLERMANSPTPPPGSPPPAKELALNYLSDFGGHPPTAVRLLS